MAINCQVNSEDEADMEVTIRIYMKDPATIYLIFFPWRFPIVRGGGLNKCYSSTRINKLMCLLNVI